MSAISIFITALALAMDAMSLAIFQGIASTENQRKENLIKIALTFGIFQFGMAFIGSVSGTFFIHYISKYSKYISFANLCQNELLKFFLLLPQLLVFQQLIELQLIVYLNL